MHLTTFKTDAGYTLSSDVISGYQRPVNVLTSICQQRLN